MAVSDYDTRRLTNSLTQKAPDPKAKLKAIAGQLQSLSYSEMKELAAAINTKINGTGEEIPEVLLAVAADILKD